MAGSYFLFAYKNIKRRPIRTLLAGSAIAMSVSAMVVILGIGIGYRKALTAEIEKSGYQVLVTAKGCPYEAATIMLKGGGGLRYISEDIFYRIAKDPLVSTITPQLIHIAHDTDENRRMFLLGVELESFLKLKPWLKFNSGKGFSGTDADEVIMGYEAAELEQRHVGDELYLSGIEKSFEVAGILERSGSQEDGTVFLPLRTLQRISGHISKVTGMGLRLRDAGRFQELFERLYKIPEIQVVSMGKVREKFLFLFGRLKGLLIAVGVVALLISIVSLINTMLMSVFERTSEIGVMKAVGAGPWDILRLIWAESILISLLGWIIGIIFTAISAGTVTCFFARILPYAPSGNLVLVPFQLLAASLASTIMLGVLAGTYPALRASLMRPAQAIRRSAQ
ncbi:MAG: FtsX-like permease family protein [Thermodesulfobacteriota bacterium]|nr:FtsX-like permease family protein [Thermodesulfobacteriota bacterium]